MVLHIRSSSKVVILGETGTRQGLSLYFRGPEVLQILRNPIKILGISKFGGRGSTALRTFAVEWLPAVYGEALGHVLDSPGPPPGLRGNRHLDQVLYFWRSWAPPGILAAKKHIAEKLIGCSPGSNTLEARGLMLPAGPIVPRLLHMSARRKIRRNQ